MSVRFVCLTLGALACLFGMMFLEGCTVISKAPELRACEAERAKALQVEQVCEQRMKYLDDKVIIYETYLNRVLGNP